MYEILPLGGSSENRTIFYDKDIVVLKILFLLSMFCSVQKYIYVQLKKSFGWNLTLVAF
jgi:hypothetical protein